MLRKASFGVGVLREGLQTLPVTALHLRFQCCAPSP